MLAVGIEGGELDLVLALGAGEIDDLLLTLVPHHELAPAVWGGQIDDEGGHHPITLFHRHGEA